MQQASTAVTVNNHSSLKDNQLHIEAARSTVGINSYLTGHGFPGRRDVSVNDLSAISRKRAGVTNEVARCLRNRQSASTYLVNITQMRRMLCMSSFNVVSHGQL